MLNGVLAGLSCADWKALYLDTARLLIVFRIFRETNWCKKCELICWRETFLVLILCCVRQMLRRRATIVMRGGGPQMTNMGSVVQLLKQEHERLTRQIQGVSAALAAFGASYSNGSRTGTGTISAAGRARIAAAQRARWAKLKGKGTRSASSTMPKKRTMSVAARKRIAAAQRARWAKVRAGK